MTKKSLSRQQRDQDARNLANINCWDDLNATANAIRNGMEVSNSTLRLALDDLSLFKYMPQKADCIAAIQTLTADLNVFTKELHDIGTLHEGKRGAHSDIEDLADSLRTGEMYHAFQARYQVIVIPNVQIVAEQIGHATNARRAAIAATPIIDASVLPAATDAQPAQAAAPESGIQYIASPMGRSGKDTGLYTLDEAAFQPAGTPAQGAAPSAA